MSSPLQPIQAALAQKAQSSSAPAPATQDQPQNSPAPQQDATDQQTPETDDSTLPAEDAGGVNLHRAFSKLNQALTKLADESGVPRSATIPHTDGQAMHDHIADVGRVLSTVGGLTANMLTAGHSVYGSGVTVAHPSDKLRETIIPKNDENAKAAISACKSLVKKVESLLGEDDPAVKLATSQIQLVGKNGGAGMSVLDLMAALINIPGPVIQSVARAHSMAHPDGMSPKLRAPHNGASSPK